MNSRETIRGTKFYCFGDRIDQYGTLEDFVVLYVTERAKTYEEAEKEFLSYSKHEGERFRLSIIVKSSSQKYYEDIE